MRAAESFTGLLWRHDSRIAINTVRATFAGWHDRLIAATVLLVALAVLRAKLADLSWETAAWVVLVAGVVVGIGAARIVEARLEFHAFDGLLPAEALRPSTRRPYAVAWHVVGIALLAAVTLVARPLLLIVSVAAYLAGVLAARLTDGFGVPGIMAGKSRSTWTTRAWLHQPGAGAAAATILLLSLLPASKLGADALVAIVGIETVLLALPLTIIDDGVVRFMAMAGHGSLRIVLHHGRGMALYVAVTTPVCWLALGSVAAGLVATISIAMLLLMTLRILAYRLHGRRIANFIVSILAALHLLVAYSMPIAAPFVAIAILWRLQRRGSAKTWLLA